MNCNNGNTVYTQAAYLIQFVCKNRAFEVGMSQASSNDQGKH